MLTLKTKLFHKWAKKLKLQDEALKKSVNEVAEGRYDAYLGGNIYKKRVAIGNRGKSAGTRTIVALKKGDKAFLIYGYAKNVQANIKEGDKKALIKYSRDLFAMDAKKISEMINDGKFIEVK